MNAKAEVSTTLTIVQRVSLTFDSFDTLLYAKQRADREFDRYFPKIYPYITKIEAEIVREVGIIDYLIRVYVTCPLEVVQEFHKAAGVYVDIPREQITKRDDRENDPFALDRGLLGEKPSSTT